MADLSLYLTNANISLAQTMEADTSAGEECEAVKMATDVEKRVNVKTPLRTIYFASGETMEEFSTDEEEEEEEPMRKQVSNVDMSKLTWGPYFWFHMWRMATNTISVCDYMGEKLASLFGITSPKYQYAIDEYYRMKKEEEEDEEENRLSFEAEQRRGDDSSATVEQPEPSAASFVNISFELTPEPLRKTQSNRVPSPLPS